MKELRHSSGGLGEFLRKRDSDVLRSGVARVGMSNENTPTHDVSFNNSKIKSVSSSTLTLQANDTLSLSDHATSPKNKLKAENELPSEKRLRKQYTLTPGFGLKESNKRV
jgi:hypothetical protein